MAPNSQTAILLGVAQWQAGNKDDTLATFKEWIAQHPSDVAVQYQLANSYLLLNQFAEARSAFSRLVQLAPNHVLGLNNLAWLMREEDPPQALKYAERALELAPENPLVMDTLGELLLDQGNSDRARQLLTKASAKAPENLDIRYHLILALSKSGETDKARQLMGELLADKRPFSNRQAAEQLAKSLGVQ